MMVCRNVVSPSEGTLNGVPCKGLAAPKHVKDPPVDFDKSRLIWAATGVLSNKHQSVSFIYIPILYFAYSSDVLGLTTHCFMDSMLLLYLCVSFCLASCFSLFPIVVFAFDLPIL